MATVEPSQLSSNWKKLQATLPPKKESAGKPQNSLKRKHPAHASEWKSQPARKRIRPDSLRARKAQAQMNASGGQKTLLHSKSVPSLRASVRHDESDDDDNDDDRPTSEQGSSNEPLTIAAVNEGVSQTAIAGKYIALDCEMVGYGPNPRDDSQLARVSIVNFHGDQIYDSYVLPQVPVTDYRTHITGITDQILETGRPFKEVRKDVETFLSGRVLVGHALKNDLTVLKLSHSMRDMRDTSRHANYRALSKGKSPALKRLCLEVLGLEIQTGHHSSVEDARAAMLLFKKEKPEFEVNHMSKFGKKQSSMAHGLVADAKRKKKRNG